MNNVSLQDIRDLLVPVPPMTEQRRIVAKVAELMSLCDQLEKARADRETKRDKLTTATLARLHTPNPETFRSDARFALDNLQTLTKRQDQIKQLRQTILALAIRGKLVPQDSKEEPAEELLGRMEKEVLSYRRENWIASQNDAAISEVDAPFSAPPGWTWTRLSKLFRVITDGDHQPPPKADKGVAFLTIGNVTTGKLDFSGCRYVPSDYFRSLAPYRTPKKGDILYTVVGATYGRPIAVDTDREFCVQRHIAILKPCREMDYRFLLWLLASPFIYRQASENATGTAQPTIPLRPLRNFLAPLPPGAEQRRMVMQIDRLMSLCDELEVALGSSDKARNHLLNALIAEALQRSGAHRQPGHAAAAPGKIKLAS